jgi:carboxyl-terminal processing protease
MTARFRKWGPIITALLVGMVLGGWAVERVGAGNDLYTYLDLFNDALAKVEGAYVEDVDPKDLMYGAIRGMLATLDPYSMFLDEDAFNDFQVTTEGEFGGLGIQITVRDGVLTVVSPIEGTPAYDLGIQAGDRIVAIEGEPTRGITADEAIGQLRGEPGTTVDITIQREGVEDFLEYTVTRDIIKIDSVPYTFMLDGDIGYVRVSRFARTTTEELSKALDDLDAQGMKGLIVDVRSNPGGLLTQAVDLSDVFLDSGELVVSTKGRLEEQNQSFKARTPARYPKDFPIVVLTNGGSASASEILAGAIQDWDRGIVVGTETFGKGSVQTLMRLRPLTKDCAMKITTAKWYTASGRLIEKPERWDVEGADAAEDATRPADGPKPEYRTNAGRTVYGGGGITPDVVVEADTLPDVMVDLERRGEFFEFAVEYGPAHQDAAGEVTGAVWADFVAFLGRDGFEFDAAELERNRDRVEYGIRREMLRRLDGPNAAYHAAVLEDNQIAAAADLIREAGDLAGLFRLAEARAGDAAR